jgi:hypothetical protein
MNPSAQSPSEKVYLTAVSERDVDLLLLEEFVASPKFLSWFVRRLKLKGRTQLTSAQPSVSTMNGESDVELRLLLGTQRLLILIEDKIDAVLQPRQAARYAARATAYQRRGECDIATTVIVAPLRYGADPGFEHHVSYESIQDWFRNQPSLGARKAYKLALLHTALTKPPRPRPVPDVAATAFCTSYWTLAQEIAPDLQMPQPRERSKNSSWLYFKPEALPSSTEMAHKVGRGHVDLHFKGMGNRMARLRQRVGTSLPPGVQLVRSGKSGVVRAVVPPVDIQLPFEDSMPAARQGIEAAQMLLRWFSSYKATKGR